MEKDVEVNCVERPLNLCLLDTQKTKVTFSDQYYHKTIFRGIYLCMKCKPNLRNVMFQYF